MRPRGFTLIELMIILALIAVAMSLAYPRATDALRKGRARAGAKGIINEVLVAKSEAVIRNAYHLVTLNAASDTGATNDVNGGGSVTVDLTSGPGCTGVMTRIDTFSFTSLRDVNLCLVRTSSGGVVQPTDPCAPGPTRLCANPDGSISNLDTIGVAQTIAYVRENDTAGGVGVVRQVVIPSRKTPRLLPVQVTNDACF